MREGHRRGTSHADAFDQVAANLRQQWLDDGLGYAGDLWEGQPTLYKLTYLANFAAAMGVTFERFAEAARGIVALETGQQCTPEHESFIAHEFQQATGKYTNHRAMDGMRVNIDKKLLAEPGKISLQDLRQGSQEQQKHREGQRAKSREIGF
jgi:hypothetical protein